MKQKQYVKFSYLVDRFKCNPKTLRRWLRINKIEPVNLPSVSRYDLEQVDRAVLTKEKIRRKQ